MTGDVYGGGPDGSISGTNVAAGDAHVETQAGFINHHTVVHGDVYLNRDDSPKEKLRIAANRLDDGYPRHAEELIAAALASEPDLFCPEVAYHRVLAVLSGRSFEGLEDESFEALRSCFERARVHTRDQWRDALDVVEKLLGCH